MEIAPGVHSIAQAKGGHVHAFLLDDGTDLTLVDTLYDTDARRVLAAIAALGRPPTDLKRIVLTHAHRSHLGGLAALKRVSGAEVWAHEREADIVAGERPAQPAALPPMRPVRAYWRVYHLQYGSVLGLSPHDPCAPDRAAGDGARIGPLEVIHTPGHAPGHLALWWPERRVLFAGDAVATYPTLAPGWPAFTLNRTQHRASLERLAQVEAEVVAVGHGEAMVEDARGRMKELAVAERSRL